MTTTTGTIVEDGGTWRRPGWAGWLLLAPVLLWLAAFVVAPNAIMVAYSLCDRDELGQVVPAVTGANYARVVDRTYLRILGSSLAYAAVATAICLLAGYPVAWFIGRAPPRWQRALLVLVMIPFWTSFLIRTYGWITILKSEGLLSAVLRSARIIDGPLDLLYTPAAVVIGLVHSYLPFMILPIHGSVEKLDPAVVEAAFDLGAGPVRTFFRVILPLTWPGVAAGILLVFVPAIGMFAVTDLLGGARVPMIGNVIQNQFGQARDWPFGAALATTLLALFAATFWLATQRRRQA